MNAEPGKVKMDRCISRLVLSQPFYATLALRLERREDPASETALWTDGKTLAYNSDKIASLRDDEITGATCKLVEALAHCHHLRRGTRERQIWQEASASICATLATQCGFSLPKEDIQFPNPAYLKESAETLYNQLKNRKQQKGGGQGGQGNGKSNGKGKGKQNQNGNGKQDGTSQNNGRNPPPSSNNYGSGEIRDYPAKNEADRQAAEESQKAATFQAARIAKTQGICPAHAERLIQDLTSPKLNWKEILRDFFSNSKNKYDWNTPNRRYIAQNLYLPSRKSRNAGTFIFAVDTSGSIGDKELNQFASEIDGILQDNPEIKIKILYCDADLKEGEEVSAEDTPLKLSPVGGGGTDFRPVFNWIEEKAAEDFKALIYLTDLYGTFPAEKPSYPVLWGVIKNGEEESEPVPFGEKVEIDFREENENFAKS